jgi:restriction system protein
MWPALVAMKKLGGSATNEELLEKVIEIEQIPEPIQNLMHTERLTKVGYRMRWAQTYLKAYGAFDNPSRGVWSSTEKGNALSEKEVESIPSQVRKLLRQEKEIQHKDAGEPDVSEIGEENWKDQLLSVLVHDLKPDGFERLAQRLLRESGFVKVEVTRRSGDGGIDGVGVLRIRLLSFQVLFQCKKYKGSVTPKEIRDFRGAMVGRTDKGLFITTGTFTADAKKEATRDGAPAIDLIDGDQLRDLLKDLKLGVSTEMVEKVNVSKDWFAKI